MHCKENEILINLFLKVDKKKTCINVINNECWSLEKYFSNLTERDFTDIIEIQKNYWICLHITEEGNNETEQYRTAFYIDPLGKDLPTDINTHLEERGIQLNNFKWIKSSDIHISWIYSLFAVKEILCPSSSFLLNPHLPEINEKAESFLTQIIDTKNQFQKVKDKIKVCSQLFSPACNRKIPKIPNYKYALLILQFIEAFAVQDKAISDNSVLKEYITDVIGIENNSSLKDIRDFLFHRDTRHEMFPRKFHKCVFTENNLCIQFNELRAYIDNVLSILEGKKETLNTRQPKDILKHSKDIGNQFPECSISHMLSKYSSELIKQGFSIYKIKYPGKTMFNFIVNFMPFMNFHYREHMEPFEDLIKLRNQLVHNIYILYQVNKELPYISFQTKLRELKEFLLIFNLCNRLSQTLQSFKVLEKHKRHKHFRKLKACFQSFIKEFKEEIYPKHIAYENMTGEESELNYLIEAIEYYLKTLPLIDKSNIITIKNIKINNFDLPTEYFRFSDIQRKLIFDHAKQIFKIDNTVSESENQIAEIESKILSLGVSKHDYIQIYNSIRNSKCIPDTELVKSILDHITNIKNMLNYSKLNLDLVTEDYIKHLDGIDCSDKTCYMNTLNSKKFKDQLYEIQISEKFIYMNLFTIVKNIIPVFFHTSRESILFHSLNKIFNDEKVLNILTNESFVMEELKCHIMSLDELVPLGTKLLCDKKLQIKDKNEQRTFIIHLLKILLKPQFKDQYLHDLLSFNAKDNNLSIFDECCKILFDMEFASIDKRKLKFLFSFDGFQKKIIDFKSLAKDSSQAKLVKYLLKYKYQHSKESYIQKNYIDALHHTDERKIGLSAIVSKLLENKVISYSFQVVEMKVLIAQIKIKIGIENRDNNTCNKIESGESDLKSRKYFDDSKKILESILFNLLIFDDNSKQILHWMFYIYSYLAYTYKLLAEYSISLKIYLEIFNELYSLRSLSLINNSQIHSFVSFKALLKSPEYLSAIKLNPAELNIFQILNKINLQRYWLANSTENKESENVLLIEALSGFQRAHLIQKKILGFKNKITIFSLLKIGKITLRLNVLKHSDLYKKSAALLILPPENKLQGKDIQIVNQFRKQIDKKLQKVGFRKAKSSPKKIRKMDSKLNKISPNTKLRSKSSNQ